MKITSILFDNDGLLVDSERVTFEIWQEIFLRHGFELTMEQYAEMAEIARKRRSEKVKPVIALRISPDTLEKAKATGKGYTGFLSRLLDNAINDPQLVAKSM